MNKFNKIFRKSVAIPSGNDFSSSSGMSSSPPTQSYMPSGGLSNSAGNISNTHNYSSGGGGSSSNNSGGTTSTNNNSVSSSSLNISSSRPPTHPQTISSSNSMMNLNSNNQGGSSSNNLYGQYQPLQCIDFDSIFNQFLNESSGTIKSYYLVHSILSKKDYTTQNGARDERSNSNSIHHHHHDDASVKSSWQPFYKKNSNASFIILCKKSIIILDASTHPFTISKRIPIGEIREIICETSDLGLFSIELNQANAISNPNLVSNVPTPSTPSTPYSPNILFFTVGCEKREIQEQLNQSFDEILKEYYKDKDIFVLKKCNMLGSVDQSKKKEFKDYVNQVLDEISMYGFSAQDLWEGNADLKFWVNKIKDKIVLNNDERYVVEFILPEISNNNNSITNCKRIYRVPNDISIQEITNFLCIKTQVIQDSSIYTLSTIKGKELDGDDILADYGLGSFFDNWQLVLVERGKTRRAGLFNLEVHFPDNPEYRGRYHRVLELDGYMTANKLVKYIGEQMDIAKPHTYSIRLDIIVTSSPSSLSTTPTITVSDTSSIILDDNDYLTTHGLGSKFLKCKLKLLPKKYPKANKDKRVNYEITHSIVSDIIIENAWKEYNQRKEDKVSIICNDIIEQIIDIAVLECKRSSSLSVRMASLGLIGRTAMYKLLQQKEQEELNFYKIDGQKLVANEAKDLINSLTPLHCPSAYDVQLDEDQSKSLLHRVAPPPPPPILGFKDFKPKKKSLIDDGSNSSGSSSQASHIKSNNPLANGVDMNQILNMRSKLRAMKKDESSNDNIAEERNKVNFTLRNTKAISKPMGSSSSSSSSSPQVTNETNELMQKLQKRHAAVALDAEDLGDS